MLVRRLEGEPRYPGEQRRHIPNECRERRKDGLPYLVARACNAQIPVDRHVLPREHTVYTARSLKARIRAEIPRALQQPMLVSL